MSICNICLYSSDMKGSVQIALDAPDMSGVRNEVVAIEVPFPLMEEDDEQDQDCPLDFQDTFGFLDLMDSSASTKVCVRVHMCVSSFSHDPNLSSPSSLLPDVPGVLSGASLWGR